MDSEILSLKSIYRLLRVRDYPVPSDGIIRPEDAKGLTLVSFWKQVLCERWLQTQHGRIIWRSEGSINRYHSELCNRKSRFPFYAEYTREILDALSDVEIFHQSELFARFLREKNYRRPIFLRKLTSFLEMLRETDRSTLGLDRLSPLLTHPSPEVPADFVDGWLLTVLTLSALTDGRIAWPTFSERGLSLSPDALYLSIHPAASSAADILTDQSGELWHAPLSANSFFGRERELFDLTEAAIAGKKVLLCGLGGVGKTELLRQLLCRFLQTDPFRQVAAVQYNGDLVRSFTRSFLRLRGATPEECFHESMYLLSHASHPILMIDNVTSPDDPALKELKDLPCPVLISARFSSLPGFVSYPLGNPDRTAAELIFRSNYRQALAPEDLPSFGRLMDQESLHHPLTVTLIARAARANRWRPEDLEKKMLAGYSEIRFREDMKKVDLNLVLRRLYEGTHMAPQKMKVLRLLSILPYQAYPAEELMHLSGMENEEKTKDDLLWLARRGWLDASDDTGQMRCVMHPLIAECLRLTTPHEHEFEPFWLYAGHVLSYDLRNLPPDEGLSEKKHLAESVLHAALLLHQPVSRTLAETCIQAALWLDEDLTAAQHLKSIVSAIPGEKTDLLLKTDERFMPLPSLPDPDIMTRMKQEMDHPILPPAWHRRYVIQSLGYLENSFDHQKVLDLLAHELSQTDLTPFEKQQLLMIEAVCLANLQSNAAGYRAGCQGMAIAEALEEGREKKPYTLIWAEYLATCLVRLGRTDELEDVQKRIQELRTSTPESLSIKVQNECLYAQIAENDGRFADAMAIWQNLQEDFIRYCGAGSPLYVQACSQLGLLSAKIGKTKEAADYYDEGLKLCRVHPEFAALLHILLNNKAVLLLDLEKTDDALPLLREAVALSTPLGGIPLAEPRKNLARCLHMRGESGQAKVLYEEVLPVFVENYGDQHPKTIEVRRHLQELTDSSQ